MYQNLNSNYNIFIFKTLNSWFVLLVNSDFLENHLTWSHPYLNDGVLQVSYGRITRLYSLQMSVLIAVIDETTKAHSIILARTFY
jgi:hypothetical protein